MLHFIKPQLCCSCQNQGYHTLSHRPTAWWHLLAPSTFIRPKTCCRHLPYEGEAALQHLVLVHFVYEAQGPWRVCDATCGYSGRRSGPSYDRGPVVTILSLVVALPWPPTERWWGRPQPGLRGHTTSQSPAASASGGISHWTDFWIGEVTDGVALWLSRRPPAWSVISSDGAAVSCCHSVCWQCT